MMLYTSVMMMSTCLEKPQIAPMITPTVILMRAQTSASEMEIREPYQIASKVELPAAPVPRIQWILCPNFSIARDGVRCFAAESSRLTKGSYSVTSG